MKKKYVKLTYVGFFLFDEGVPHIHIKPIAEQGGYRVLSAGFWDVDDDGLAVCFGESVGLRVKSVPEDTDQLREFLGQPAATSRPEGLPNAQEHLTGGSGSSNSKKDVPAG